MLEKYLNKEIIVEEKLFSGSASTFKLTGNKIYGVLTGYDEDFIELDNNSLIERNHIYRIGLK